MDAGYFINTSCPAMFRPGRRLDLIISFDYSLSSPFEVLLVVPWETQTLFPARPHSRGEQRATDPDFLRRQGEG